MKIKIQFIKSLILIAILLCPRTGLANDTLSKFAVGAFVEYNFNSHSADFKNTGDCPSCSPGYSTGAGSGVSFGALGEYYFSDPLRFALRIAYDNISAKLTRNENTTIFLAGKEQIGTFEHSFDAVLNKIAIQPYVKYKIFSDIYVDFGLDIGVLVKKQYDQIEKIISPANDGTFIDANGASSGKRTRNEFSGAIKNATAVLLSSFLGVSYELPLNISKTTFLEPSLSYNAGLNNIVDNSNVAKWKSNSLKFGLAFKTQISNKPEIIEKYEKNIYIDTIVINSNKYIANSVVIGQPGISEETIEEQNVIIHKSVTNRTDTLFLPKNYVLKATIEAVGLDSNKVEITGSDCTVEEFVVSKLEPILNYIFFAENSDSLDKKYIRLKKKVGSKFDESELFNNSTLDSYYNVLNIIGARLNKNPTAKLNISGCNDGFTGEKDNLKLSLARAETVKRYLVSEWGIAPGRLNTIAFNLPEKHSTPIYETDKMEENRRVEISSDNAEITKPLFLSDTARTAIPAVYKFKPTVIAEAGLKEWRLNVKQSGKVVSCFTYKTTDAAPVELYLTGEQKLKLDYSIPVYYNIEAVDNNNAIVSEADKLLEIKLISVKKKRASKIADKEIDNYSLILFDFDKADIDLNNTFILDIINKRIVSDSKIQITGYTDRTGDDSYNRDLSGRRAEAVKKLIKAKYVQATGVGKDLLIYNNDTPEGRFYCRTVKIRVETNK